MKKEEYENEVENILNEGSIKKRIKEPIKNQAKNYWHTNHTKIIIISITLAIILGFFTILSILVTAQTTTKLTEEVIRYEKNPQIEEIAEIITFGQQLRESKLYENKEIVLKGHLSERTQRLDSRRGLVIYSIIDDIGNEIELRNFGEYKALFPENNVSTKLFTVEGLFKREYDKVYIEISGIKPAVRDYTTVTDNQEIAITEMITRDIVEPKYPNIRNSIIGKLILSIYE